MGLFDFLKRKEQPSARETEQPVQKSTEPYLGDLTKTDTLINLFNTTHA